MRFLLLLSATSLAACAPDEEHGQGPPAEPAARAPAPDAGSPARPPGPPAPPPPVPSPWGLLPLDRARIAAELGARPQCALSDKGRLLMAAVGVRAVANDGGIIVTLRREEAGAGYLFEGGRFVAGELAIEVRPGAELSRRGGLVERDSSVGVVRGRRGFSVSHGPRWTCSD